MTLNTNKLDGLALNQTATATPTAQEVTLYLGTRQRMRSALTDLDATEKKLLRMGKKIVHAEYTKYWEALQAQGVGSIVHGRGGNPTRFVWSYSLREVAKAAIEGKDLNATPVVNPAPRPMIKPVLSQSSRQILKTGDKKPARKKLTIVGKKKGGRPPTVVSLNLSLNEVQTLQRILAKAKK